MVQKGTATVVLFFDFLCVWCVVCVVCGAGVCGVCGSSEVGSLARWVGDSGSGENAEEGDQ